VNSFFCITIMRIWGLKRCEKNAKKKKISKTWNKIKTNVSFNKAHFCTKHTVYSVNSKLVFHSEHNHHLKNYCMEWTDLPWRGLNWNKCVFVFPESQRERSGDRQRAVGGAGFRRQSQIRRNSNCKSERKPTCVFTDIHLL